MRVGVLVCSLLPFLTALPTLAVTTTDLTQLTPQQLAQLLAGPGVTVSNVTFTGASVAGGSFAGGLADGLGIDTGVILSSGNVANAAGPNDDDGITGFNERPGDASLNVIVGEGHTTFDAAVLEFDFVPASSTVSFRYVFASDEYNEFVGLINDVFAFFIDGQNVALVPGTSTPIAINTVNLDTNSAFYRNNDPSDLGIPTPFGTQFDGFTTVLIATATLTPNVSHHIKLAIADTDDFVLDSAVFLQAASFVSENLTIGKTAPPTVATGANLTYTITYGNSGNLSATSVVIRDPVPSGSSFVSATNGGTLQAGAVVWNIGTLGPGVTGQTVSFTVQVNATSGSVTNANYTIAATDVPPITGTPVSTTVSGGGCPTISLSPAALPGGTLGTAYSQSITASGGAAPYAFSITSGALPPELTLSSGGILSGTPTASGTYSFTVQAFDSNECTGTRSYTLSIGCPAIALSPTTLPNGALSTEYNQSITASGGTAPYAFSITSGALPPGLTLSTGGVLSGIPTAGGSYSFTVRATDANQCTGSRTYTLSITGGGCGTITVSPSVLFEGFVGVAYNRTLHGVGGTSPYRFSVTSGSLPPGLTLSSGGAFSGTPTAAGTYSFRVRAVDASQCSGSQSYTVRIACPPVLLSPAVLPPASQGVPYIQTITALTGGAGPYTFSASAGLPPGLTLLPSGAFSGAPTLTGSFSFTVTATDSNGCSTSQAFTLSVCATLTITPVSLFPAAVGVPYGQQFAASSGTAPFAFAITGGTLPPGLAFSGSGLLAGTPLEPGNFSFTVTATDANGCTGSATYTLCSGLAISPGSLPDGEVGTPYSATLTVSGGMGPYTLIASPPLPPGLALSTAGTLSGTPTQSGTFEFRVAALDVVGCTGQRIYSVRVSEAPPVISGLTLSPAAPESFTLTIAGSGFVEGAVVVVNEVSYPATFGSPGLLTVTLPASAIPTNGTLTATVINPGTTGGTSNPATLTFCEPPEAPLTPTITSFGNPTGPLTATDFLLVSWQAPAGGSPPSAYDFRINGDPDTTVVGGTSAVAPPRGSNDPITLHVRGKCNPDVAGPEAVSPTYSLAPPVADFTFSAATAGSPVSFTDTSSPQATSWLWIFDDGGTSTAQSPTHTFTTAGTHQVALIASNGSGSSTRIKDVSVSASGALGSVAIRSLRSFAAAGNERWRLPWVAILSGKPASLEIMSDATEETVVYLRFLDGEGRLVLERRISVAPGETAVNDVSAWGLEGLYTLELVSRQRIEAVLAQPFDRPGKRQEGADENP
jgi:uncharacterized repeat protein (TIGR01451 family)